MEFVARYFAEICALLTPIVAWGLNRYLAPRARLVYGVRHAFTFLLDEPTYNASGDVTSPTKTVSIASLSVVNTGRLPTKNVELVFNWQPQHINIWPSRHYIAQTAPDGRHSLLFSSLAPTEFIGMEIMSVVTPLPDLITVRSEDCCATKIPLTPQEVHPQWKLRLVLWLAAIGAAAHIYLVVSALLWAIHRGM